MEISVFVLHFGAVIAAGLISLTAIWFFKRRKKSVPVKADEA